MKVKTSYIVAGLVVLIALVMLFFWSKKTGLSNLNLFGAGSDKYKLTNEEHRVLYGSQIYFPMWGGLPPGTGPEVDFVGERIASIIRPRMPKDLQLANSKKFTDTYWTRIMSFLKGADLAATGDVIDNRFVADFIVKYLTSGQAKEVELTETGEFKSADELLKIENEAKAKACGTDKLYDAAWLICYPASERKEVKGNPKQHIWLGNPANFKAPNTPEALAAFKAGDYNGFWTNYGGTPPKL